MARTDQDYIAFDPYQDECNVRHKRVKIVTTRKAHDCYCCWRGRGHQMPIGTRARYETAQVEGQWSRYYTCLACIESWLSFCENGHPPETCTGCGDPITNKEGSDEHL